MPKSFARWFRGIDLNQPLDEEKGTGFEDDRVGTSRGHGEPNGSPDHGKHGSPAHDAHHGSPDLTAGQEAHVAPPSGSTSPSASPSGSAPNPNSNAYTRVTLSSEDSDNDGEVQSTPEGFIQRFHLLE
jgi:hypothetical protein